MVTLREKVRSVHNRLVRNADRVFRETLEMTVSAVPMFIFCAVMISTRTVRVRMMIVALNVAIAMSIIVSIWRRIEKGLSVVVPMAII